MSLIKKYTLNKLAEALGNSQVDADNKVIMSRSLRTSMESAFKQYILNSRERYVNVIIKNVMQDTLAAAEGKVSDTMILVQSNLDAKNKKREEIILLQEIISENKYPADFLYTDKNGNKISVVLESKEQAEALLHDLESMLQTFSEMSSLQMMQLQQAMIRQQQLMQIISNIMKNMHDTLKAIIQNLR